MEPRKVYITPDKFEREYSRADGNFYTGYVIGLGYVRPKAGMLYPSHWRGYNAGAGYIPMDDKDCVGLWQYEVDSSPEAVMDSLTPLRDVLRKALVQDNGDGTVQVNVGMNQFINYPKGYGTSDINFVRSTVNANQIALQISIEIKDDVGSVTKKEHQILAKDLGVAFDLNAIHSLVKQWIDLAEIGSGIGGILFSATKNFGEPIYEFNMVIQYNSNFEVVNYNKMKVVADNSGKIWKIDPDSKLVPKALANRIPNISRYYPRIAPYVKKGGKICGSIGIVCSGIRFTDACLNVDGLEMLDSGMDLIMGRIGFIPFYGWMVSGGYFLIKPLVKYHAKTVLKAQIGMGVAGLPGTLAYK